MLQTAGGRSPLLSRILITLQSVALTAVWQVGARAGRGGVACVGCLDGFHSTCAACRANGLEQGALQLALEAAASWDEHSAD